MLGTSTLKRIAATTLVGGVLAVAPFMAPVASAAPVPAGCETYSGTITTSTDLTIQPDNPAVGEGFTATATVTNDATGLPVPTGSVTFTYAGTSKTDAVDGSGQAQADFTRVSGQQTLTATYSGTCVGDVAGLDTSDDSLVLGTESSTGGGGGGNGNGAGISGSGAGTGGLAATGVDTQTELLGVLGLGLVAVGGLSLVVRRRRVQA